MVRLTYSVSIERANITEQFSAIQKQLGTLRQPAHRRIPRSCTPFESQMRVWLINGSVRRDWRITIVDWQRSVRPDRWYSGYLSTWSRNARSVGMMSICLDRWMGREYALLQDVRQIVIMLGLNAVFMLASSTTCCNRTSNLWSIVRGAQYRT
jgi:hypothetical protein